MSESDEDTPPSPTQELLHAWKKGDQEAFDQLLPRVEAELKKLARVHLKREAAGHSLDTCDLIQEAFLRLDRAGVINDRGHFLVLASRTMRRILVDHARARKAHKRGHDVQRVVLDEARDELEREPVDLDRVLMVHDALARYAELDPRRATVVELRYFGALTIDEIAAALAISPATVKLDLKLARLWLARSFEES